MEEQLNVRQNNEDVDEQTEVRSREAAPALIYIDRGLLYGHGECTSDTNKKYEEVNKMFKCNGQGRVTHRPGQELQTVRDRRRKKSRSEHICNISE